MSFANTRQNKKNHKKGKYFGKNNNNNNSKNNVMCQPNENCDGITPEDIELICSEMAGNSKLAEIIKKLEKIKENKNARKKAEDRVKEYNKCVDVTMKRYIMGVSFNDTIVGMIGSIVADVHTRFTIGFIDALPRQMIEIMCHKIGDDTDGLCDKIMGHNKLQYILLNSSAMGDHTDLVVVLKTIVNIMNIIKETSRITDIHFGSYKVTNVVNVPDRTQKNINYHISMEDSDTGDDVFIDFWLQSAEIKNSVANISTLCINNNGLVIRVRDFETIEMFENDMEESILSMQKHSKKPVYGGFFQVIIDIFNNRGAVLNKKLLERYIKKLDTHTLTRHKKVRLMLDIMSLYSEYIHTLIPKYINKTDMTGLPDYYVETEEECLYTAIAPPYIKLKLVCGHDMSIQSIYGLLVEGYNGDTESIVCQLCNEKLVFKLIEQPNFDKELLKNECIATYPHVYTYEELSGNSCTDKMVVKNSTLNRESSDYIDNMMSTYYKDLIYNASLRLDPDHENDEYSVSHLGDSGDDARTDPFDIDDDDLDHD